MLSITPEIRKDWCFSPFRLREKLLCASDSSREKSMQSVDFTNQQHALKTTFMQMEVHRHSYAVMCNAGILPSTFMICPFIPFS